MAEASVVIGLVTYPGTRFPESSGSGGAAWTLARLLQSAGIPAEVAVHGSNDHDEHADPVDIRRVEASVREQLRVETAWRCYVAGRPVGWIDRGVESLRRVKAAMRYTATRAARRRGDRMVVRLLNIQSAHEALLRAGLDAGATWIVIVEDDAVLVDADACVAVLRKVCASPDGPPDYINLSRSFSTGDLHVETLLRDTDSALTGVTIRVASRPISNTVCAIAYRAGFARMLLEEYRRLDHYAVIPIDWRLNAALMAMTERGDLGGNSCWFVEPGPLVQGSMQEGGPDA